MYIDGWGKLPLVGVAGVFENGSSSFSGTVDGATSVSQDISCERLLDDSNWVTRLYTISVDSRHHWTSFWNCWKMHITVPAGSTSGCRLILVLSW